VLKSDPDRKAVGNAEWLLFQMSDCMFDLITLIVYQQAHKWRTKIGVIDLFWPI
jgi:hypothetical protein